MLLGADTKRVLGEECVTGLELNCGRIVQADFVVCAVGIRPQTQLANDAGLTVNRGIVVDDQLATSDSKIFALGECAEHRGVVYGLVEPAYEQAKVLARKLAGEESASYAGSILATNLKVSGVSLFSAGEFMESSTDDILLLEDHGTGVYKKLVIENHRLKGAVLFGDTADGLWYQGLIREGADVSQLRDVLAFGPALALSQAA